jgi:hypothetical protein
MMAGIGWISYTSQNIPGNQSFELGFHANLREVQKAYEEYCEAVGTEDVSMTIYSTIGDKDGEMVKAAKEFEGIGCPFDYPDKIIERGPHGAIKVVNT